MLHNIWIINHYASSDFVDKGGRHYWFAKYLKRLGYSPSVFCCNTIHNTERRYFQNDELVNKAVEENIGVPFVFLKGRQYVGNGKNRILNMLDFYRNIMKVAPDYAAEQGKPDIVYASSVHPFALVAGIKLARRFNVKCVCEVRDLWPDSIVAMGIASKNHPFVRFLYMLKRWVYKNCDALITTFEGGYDYILENGYDNLVPREKYYYINNGVDLEAFYENAKSHTISDEDLDDENTFKIIYTGSIRLANGLDQLLDCAKSLLDYKDIKFLVYGRGDAVDGLTKRIKSEGITNVHLKGAVEKKYIPYILSRGSVNMLNFNIDADDAALYAYGSSQNKLFEYLASRRPIISNAEIRYDIILKYNCGIAKTMRDGETYANALLELYNLSEEEYSELCQNSYMAAKDFDFKRHTEKLIDVFRETMER